MLNIAISGKICSGKDSAAEILTRILPVPIQLKFADPVYRMCSSFESAPTYNGNGWIPSGTMLPPERIASIVSDEIEHTALCNLDEEHKRTIIQNIVHIAQSCPTTPGVKNREMIRGVAEYLRSVNPRMFTAYLATRYESYKGEYENNMNILISDLRFPVELQFAKQYGFQTLRINVSPDVQKARMTARKMDPTDLNTINHYGETALDEYKGWSKVIQNDGSYNNLEKDIRDWVTSLPQYSPTPAI